MGMRLPTENKSILVPILFPSIVDTNFIPFIIPITPLTSDGINNNKAAKNTKIPTLVTPPGWGCEVMLTSRPRTMTHIQAIAKALTNLYIFISSFISTLYSMINMFRTSSKPWRKL